MNYYNLRNLDVALNLKLLSRENFFSKCFLFLIMRKKKYNKDRNATSTTAQCEPTAREEKKFCERKNSLKGEKKIFFRCLLELKTKDTLTARYICTIKEVLPYTLMSIALFLCM